jgi:hypothetical protein
MFQCDKEWPLKKNIIHKQQAKILTTNKWVNNYLQKLY